MRIRKTEPSTGVLGKIVNEYSESTTDTYSCDYVNDTIAESIEDTYSETETLTNKVWIDNKPIYRKVVDTGSLPNATTKTVAHGITNVDNVITIYGVANNGTEKIPLPFLDINNNSYGVMLWVNKTNVTLVCGDNKSSYNKSYVVIEYTKTSGT